LQRYSYPKFYPAFILPTETSKKQFISYFALNLWIYLFFFVDSLCVLKGFDSSLAHGRKYGFVGRDGLAKTTLLHDFIVKKNTK
jgi:ABC-type polysaccharide/polyol phosphate transport system ATPase subunit